MTREKTMTSASNEKRPVPARCDLCGREAMPGKPYTLLSQVVTRPEKKVSLEPTDTAPPALGGRLQES